MTTAVPSKPATNMKVDPSSDVYRSESHPLDPLFLPKSVAVIGASERTGSVGRSVLWNLLSSPFGGTVFPVNSKRSNVLGIKAYPSVRDLPEKVDLVVVTTPADTVPELIRESVDIGIPAAIVISAGFKEFGEHGKELEREISQIIQGKMRVIGPNCLGVMSPRSGLNATFATPWRGRATSASSARAARCAPRFWTGACARMVGFSAFVSVGSMLDVELGRPDLLPRQRSAHAQHRDLHGIDRRRAVVPLGRARSGADQADHRHQGRTHGCGGQGRGFAHRVADRQRRSAGRGVPPQRRAARQQHRRPVLHGGSAGQAAASPRHASDHPHQRRRSRACWRPTR